MDSYSVAVDVGGTFTDIMLCNLDTNAQSVLKVPSTPDDPSAGFLNGLRQILETNGVAASQVKHVFHGTTIATNAILENKGAPVGLVVSDGFRFVLEIGRHGTPRMANPNSWVKPRRPVRPRDIVEVAERAGSAGEVLTPLDEEAVRAAARQFRDGGISSIAISFLHSYANPGHETLARELILEEFPGAQVSLSSEVLAVFREYERTITTVLNTYVMPRVSNYIANLDKGLTPTTNLGGTLGDWPIQLPMLDIVTIGCGGGSIASVSPSGSLSVGPASAGALPGPVCYGKGGTEPTVTDANLVLGRINSQIAGGQLSLDKDAAMKAIQNKIASPLGMDGHAAANGILSIANNNMVGAIRGISVERGHDPRDFALVAYGGAGPMHAIDVAILLGINRVVAPLHPGIASAYGLLAADFKNDYAKTFLQQPPDYDLEGIQRVFQELEAQGRAWLLEEGVPSNLHKLARSADLRYTHQGSEVSVPLDSNQVGLKSLHALIKEFHFRHERLYGFALEQPVEIVTLRVSVTGDVGTVEMPLRPSGLGSPDQAVVSHRQVYFGGFDGSGGFTSSNVYGREQLAPGSTISGPAILEGTDSTVIINPGWYGQIDDHGNCIMSPG